ncbi:hypothetical protein DU19_0935 [Chlamydia muridarum]|nr:hypothetical protein DU17_0937 [Chlamydia muridarum]KDU82745.1 hypothetical protein DU19_0935 [Chlamydia muridarum]KDU83830.1 hypothetical protein DU20_0935 [Chlamydia muridarum]KDU84624.1 hypothetical protein DU21_0937 [Chlamydia muridarum]
MYNPKIYLSGETVFSRSKSIKGEKPFLLRLIISCGSLQS